MKSISIVLAVLLGAVGLVWAEVTDQESNINQQQLSKRPYAASPVETSPKEPNAQAEKNYKTLQLHMLGKRPYAEKKSIKAE
jgi:hypothetical protein